VFFRYYWGCHSRCCFSDPYLRCLSPFPARVAIERSGEKRENDFYCFSLFGFSISIFTFTFCLERGEFFLGFLFLIKHERVARVKCRKLYCKLVPLLLKFTG